MNQRHYSTHTTHPQAGEAVKKVCPRKQAETPKQRRDRLYVQAAANGVRLKNLGGGAFYVPSQRTGADGRPVGSYLVQQLIDGGLSCPCEWGERRGPYTDDNPYGCCGHTAKVEVYLARRARVLARWAARQVLPLAA
jgi:hypothetical protein